MYLFVTINCIAFYIEKQSSYFMDLDVLLDGIYIINTYGNFDAELMYTLDL